MHQALYRKWRPRNFDEVSGQEHITSILKHECATGHFSHAYLFCGSRGTGKTTCAKILAKAVNCEHPTPAGPCCTCAACRSIDSGAATDVLEMDAASNNGVDDIRDIRDEVIYAPSELKYRVYIIDEVHMLSASAFNALLKTLEEPPAHVVFVLATTELHKLPATIISRCQRFDFRRIATDDLTARLHHVAREEGIVLDDDAARLIARQAQGGMRDAISLLELCAGARLPITPALVTEMVGGTGREGLLKVADTIVAKDYDALFEIIDEMVRSSRDLSVFWQDLVGLYRDMMVIKTVKNPAAAAKYLDLTDSEQDAMTRLAASFTKEVILYHCGLLEEALLTMQKSHAVKRTVAEITLLRLCDPALDASPEAILARISRLEEHAIMGMAEPLFAPAPAQTSASVAHGNHPGDVPPGPFVGHGVPEPPMDMIEPPSVQPSCPVMSPAVSSGVALSQAAAPAATQMPMPGSARNTRLLRPLRNWTEVIDRVRETSPMAASFMCRAKAYTTEDGGVLIKYPGTFERDMAQGEGAPDALRRALSVALGRVIPVQMIGAEIEGTASESSPIDEILEALDGD